MKKILIIGYGDIAKRLCSKLNDDIYKVYGVSRNNTHDAENFISWDWLSDELPKLESSDYECVVFMPKPKSFDKYGYIDGFIKSSNNIFNLLFIFFILHGNPTIWTGITARVRRVMRRSKSLGHKVSDLSTSAITGIAPAASTASAVAM